MRMRAKLNAKAEKFDEKYKSKFPKAHEKTSGYLTTFKDVWAETFPDTVGQVKEKMDRRRERAQIAKEWEEK